MIVYFSAAFVSLFFASLAQKARVKQKAVLLALSCCPLLAVASLRKFVGTDYASYLFNKIPTILNNPIQPEFGFSIVSYVFMKYFDCYQLIIVTIACVVCVTTWMFFYKESINYPLSVMIFLSFGCYYFSLNAMRQSVVIALFFFSIRYIEKRDLKKYLFLIFLGASVHSSALIFVPLYWVSCVRIKRQHVLYVSCFLYLIYPVVAKFVYSIILGKYMAYFGWGMNSGPNWRFLLPLLVVIAIDYFFKMDEKNLSFAPNSQQNIYRNLSIFCFWSCNLSPTLTGASAARVIAMFLPALSVYIPYLLTFKKKWKPAFFLSFLLLFVWTTTENVGGFLPYHSIFSDYTKSYRTYLYEKNASDNINFRVND